MKSNILASAVRLLSVLTLLSTGVALAQEHGPIHLSGLINDYSPLSATVKGSPWEMHGQWTLDIHEGWGHEPATADFAADMTMSGFGKTSAGAVDPTQPLVNPHTHHIRLTKVKITWNMDGCPAYLPPATLTGFQISDVVSLMTGNGSIAPFETNPPSSNLQVCVTGGDPIQYSAGNTNITLVFTGPATMHFGPQVIHGVVRNPTVDSAGKGPDGR
ncbi:MAG: hypothetical protein WBQ94_14980 [Terracidiphilus sp.]